MKLGKNLVLRQRHGVKSALDSPYLIGNGEKLRGQILNIYKSMCQE